MARGYTHRLEDSVQTNHMGFNSFRFELGCQVDNRISSVNSAYTLPKTQQVKLATLSQPQTQPTRHTIV
jgi:hypothetical protein